MPAAKKITPTGLISSILGLAAFGSLLFGVSNHFVSKAEAADIVAAQQADRVDTDLKLIELEIQFVESELEDHADAAEDEDVAHEKRENLKRLEYLKSRRTILEQYQLELQAK
jgi:parvulin-like peptidyl-prolyl isomerase